ncbi:MULTISPECIES: EF-P 5-aminopentanol modification-associated protein YfmH [Exiguobacterium]|uniref:Pitrilysin family protein n=1 Tax=Exiguobacterium antarcticum TaxID=132920 RepID=A0ABT6R365_9BACL|nr:MULTISPECIES: insulinase family protein [Exiguobacterium]AFS70133.1 peptidase M16 domain-containing protein [Exiguobacterium antarcticum B7]MCT4779736.1 insulinase family protein [Exiguobacterium soli]MDI3234746.1 pitrilysin family protein [Exiguobacterium antarcticum]
MEQVTYHDTDETVFFEQLDNGLTVYLLQKKGYEKTYATFTTRYGSIDNRFKKDGDWVNVPDGIAHFLEHKMFESEQGDVFQQFGRLGASANAFTSFSRTAYLFSATSLIEQNLETLIDFVQDPYFTAESVEKEKGIITQEIQMYQDNPGWRLFFGLIESMYAKHPVRIDIAGTPESINQITAEDLYTCYQTFYHPSNMVLFVVGNIDPAETLDLIKANQAKKNYADRPAIERDYGVEPKAVARKRVELELDVKTPKVLIGYKDTSLGGEEQLRRELTSELLLHLLFDQTSSTYLALYEDGLIDDTFSFDYSSEEEFAFATFGMETEDPDRFITAYEKLLAARPAFEETEVVRKRNMMQGKFLRALNSPEFIANQFSRHALAGTNLFTLPTLIASITKEEIEARFDELFALENRAISIVKPYA